MNGYKTGGDWTDVTSIGRNEVVFEGRHKAYGAYYIRQRYPSALLYALLSAIAFIATCALIAYAFRNISHMEAATKTDVAIKPTDVLIHREVIIPPAAHPHVQPPRITPNRFMPPEITQQPDSIPIARTNDHTAFVPNGIPGIGNEPPDLNPVPPSGNPLPSPPDNQIRTWVNEMPKFPGGNIGDYLAKQLRYPAEAVQLGIHGTVYASFVIERDGSVSNVVLLRGISGGPDLNKEALRVLSEMPKWAPGKQDGHPVRIQYTVPIHFKIQ
jgi:protein TonB